jgi:hypothetical protein
MWKAGTSKFVAPPVSVKDRWVEPHEQVLNVPNACWWYGPSKPSSVQSSDARLYPHCFIGWLGRETGYGPVGRSAGVLWIVSGAPFLRSSGPAQLCWRHVKGCHVWGLPVGSVRRVYVDWRGKCMCRVGRVFSCRMYINSNHCDSRIWVTACLWQSSRR